MRLSVSRVLLGEGILLVFTIVAQGNNKVLV